MEYAILKIGGLLLIFSILANHIEKMLVLDEPYEIEELGPDDLGWWQCAVNYPKYGINANWYVTWDDFNRTWEVGEE